MSYIKTSWVARVGTALNRFLKTNETSTEVELTNDPTGVSVPGTPFTVANMNKIETGIYDAHVTADANASNLLANVNQGVKTTDSPTFANSTIAGHNIDSELDTLNGRVNQGVKTTDSPSFSGLTLASTFLPRSNPVAGSQTIAKNSTWTPPRGVYVLTTAPSQVFLSIGGGGQDTTFNSGTVFASGTTAVQLKNPSDSYEVTVYYVKF